MVKKSPCCEIKNIYIVWSETNFVPHQAVTNVLNGIVLRSTSSKGLHNKKGKRPMITSLTFLTKNI